MRAAFAENFSLRNELGAACCIYHHGKKVVDLWGGIRNAETGDAWEEDTMVLVFSATKGFAAMAMALAHSRGWLDYDERVCAYWPEFAQQGKERITVRQLLAHQAGLYALSRRWSTFAWLRIWTGWRWCSLGRNAWSRKPSGLSRDQPWLLRGRTPSPSGSTAPQSWTVFQDGP